MKIKSNSHALEILQDMVKQGYLKESWLTNEDTEGRMSVRKIYKFTSRWNK